MYKLLIVFAVLSVAIADKPYAPTYKEPELPPQPFAYQYGVKDDYTGTNFDKNEEQDAYGNLKGSYRANLPDGRVQIVKYTVDAVEGFIADVQYEGEAQYPPEPKEGYGNSGPVYKSKPTYSA
uniref:Cuticle protein 7 n=1 Tax=Lepeophtheirus salmonis TaxID=72036 RepID=C1BTI4_LEPSM|nr:Cuticle protein 7 [Lepeophtheirus salmonis]